MIHRPGALVLLAALAGCGDTPSAGDETAAELRSLRVFLQQQSHAQNAGAPNAPAARAALGEALAPLREVVTALARTQGEQAARQLAMTQEMQRWSQLLIETAGSARADDSKPMAAKLQQLEQALREQEVRHREVEALLQGALDRTAERLEAFLQHLEGTGTKATDAAAPANGATPATTTPKDAPHPTPAPPRDERALPSTGRSAGIPPSGEQWLWVVLGAACLGLGAFFVRRARRRERPFGHHERPAPRAMVEPDPGVDEIWAAAALLGETVNRLRQTSTQAPPSPAPAAAVTVPDQLDLDQVFVAGAFDAAPPPKPPAPAAAPAAPQLVVCRLPAADPERARSAAARLLAADPRVLRRPAPSFVPMGNRLEVTFATLPGLPAGERSLLEQRLRDTIAPV